MNYSTIASGSAQGAIDLIEFLTITPPFFLLSPDAIEQLSRQLQPLRYRMGQALAERGTMPAHITIIYQGAARLLGYAKRAATPITLQLLQPGAIVGWASLVRGIPCETVLASTESLCYTLPAAEFHKLLEREPALAATIHSTPFLIEVFDLLGEELKRQATGYNDLKELAIENFPTAYILNLPPGKPLQYQLEPNSLWLVSSGSATNFPVGSRLTSDDYIKVTSHLRLLGLPLPAQPDSTQPNNFWANVSYAPDTPQELETHSPQVKYPYVSGRGPIDATLACFQMLSQYFGMPFKRDVLKRALADRHKHTGISLQFCGAVAELMGLTSQLVELPAVAISRLPTPALLPWQDTFAILYKTSSFELIIAVPETGIRRISPASFIEDWGESGQVLLLQPTKDTPKQRFGLSWFLPSISRYRRVLLEVFIASNSSTTIWASQSPHHPTHHRQGTGTKQYQYSKRIRHLFDNSSNI